MPITMEDKNYTIKDIARMAGVSAGTVDRVMHNRGDVSEASRIKVQQVLDEINYQPNMFAIGLAAKKRYTICSLIPYYIIDDYWYSVAKGIEKAAQELKPFNVRTEFVFYNHSDKCSYLQAQQQLLEKTPDAVLIAPNFEEETLSFTNRLHELNVPFVFIDVNLEAANALKYIGPDSFRSGYIAAKILMREYMQGKELVLFLSDFRENPAEFQMQRRLDGFMKFLNENYENLKVHEVILDRNDNEKSCHILKEFFLAHPDSTMGVVFNSRIYQVGQYLKASGRRLEGLIGYDLLPQNVELLKDGWVTYLIGQRPELQGYCAIKTLVDKVVFKKEIDPVKYMPIDILMKDNIDYYFEFV